MTDRSTQPVEVRAPRSSTTTQIVWADGHQSHYDNAILRGYCPCAACQGHSGPIKFIPGGNPDLDTIEEVGNYGLSFGWGDGHNSGIYSYQYLRRICQCKLCLPTSPVQSRATIDR